MKKEEIEERISYAKSNFTDGIEIFLEIIEKQQKSLEQKESILNKITELANKIATENAEKYNSENQKEVDFSEWNIALEILNIIEGEKEQILKDISRILKKQAIPNIKEYVESK